MPAFRIRRGQIASPRAGLFRDRLDDGQRDTRPVQAIAAVGASPGDRAAPARPPAARWRRRPPRRIAHGEPAGADGIGAGRHAGAIGWMMHKRTLDRIGQLPLWEGAITVTPLKGGLSNESYVVTDEVSRNVVRFGRDFPFHHVYRDREIMAARAAHAAGFGPELRYAEPGLMVTTYLGARTCDADDIRANGGRIAALVRAFHTEMPRHVSGPASLFWPFHVVRDYARTLRDHADGGDLDGHLALNDALEATQPPLPIVFGHNDLLPANFLDDGDRLWLIDFEYAGFSTAMFDLAGIAANAGMVAEECEALLAAYFGTTPSPELVRAHDAMQCAALLREAMWAMVSAIYLAAPGADYTAYAADNLARLALAVDRFQTRHGKLVP